MAQSINLIPQEEQQLQHKRSIVKSSSVVSILLLLVIGGIAAYYFYTVQGLQRELSDLETQIATSRSEIQSLSEMEITARELDAKYKILTDLFTTRRRYSVLLDELYKRVPAQAIIIDSLSLSGSELTQLSVSGNGTDYISIARFMDTVVDTNFSDANSGLSGLFTGVTLNSVNLSQDSKISYYMLVDFDAGLLR